MLRVIRTVLATLVMGMVLVHTTEAQDSSLSDTLFYKTDIYSTSFDASGNGPGQTWDFSRLRGGKIQSLCFDQTSDVDIWRLKSDAEISFELTRDDSGMSILSARIDNPFQPGDLKSASYKGQAWLVKEAMNSGTRYEQDFSRTLDYKSSEIAQPYFVRAPIGIDSVRIIENVHEHVQAMASGILILPSITQDVVKIKVDRKITREVWMKSNGKWISQSFSDLFEVSQFAQTLVEDEYHFVSEEGLLPLAIVHLDKYDNVSHTRYQVGTRDELFERFATSPSNVMLHPNPTFGKTTFIFENYKSGSYKILLTNIFGKKLWSKEVTIDGYADINIDFSFLSKGTYTYSIIDSGGNKVTVKRLMIISP